MATKMPPDKPRIVCMRLVGMCNYSLEFFLPSLTKVVAFVDIRLALQQAHIFSRASYQSRYVVPLSAAAAPLILCSCIFFSSVFRSRVTLTRCISPNLL